MMKCNGCGYHMDHWRSTPPAKHKNCPKGGMMVEHPECENKECKAVNDPGSDQCSQCGSRVRDHATRYKERWEK